MDNHIFLWDNSLFYEKTHVLTMALPSVNLTVFAIEAMAIEIVDLPIKNGDCP